MFQSLNNKNRNLFLFIAIENIKSHRVNSLGDQLDKGQLGSKLSEFLVNGSVQLGVNMLNDLVTYKTVLAFYDNFPQTNDWMDSIDQKIKKELKQTKTNKKQKAV